MDWQSITVAGIVGLAVVVLVRRARRWASGSCDSSCGGCQKTSRHVSSGKIITEDEISLPK